MNVTVLFKGYAELNERSNETGDKKMIFTSTSCASASITVTARVLWRVMYRIGWMMERGLRVPTATLGNNGVKRKKFLGLMTTCSTLLTSEAGYRLNTYDIVLGRVYRVEKTRCAPAATEDNDGLFRRVWR